MLINLLILTKILLGFGQAEAQFEKILEIDPYRVDDIDIYSNILFVMNNTLRIARLAHQFLAQDKDRPEVCCLVGKRCSLCLQYFSI